MPRRKCRQIKAKRKDKDKDEDSKDSFSWQMLHFDVASRARFGVMYCLVNLFTEGGGTSGVSYRQKAGRRSQDR